MTGATVQPFNEHFDPCSMIIIAWLATSSRVSSPTCFRPCRSMCLIGGLAFLASVGWVYTLSDPTKPFELVAVVLVAGGFGVGAAIVAGSYLPPTAAFGGGCKNCKPTAINGKGKRKNSTSRTGPRGASRSLGARAAGTGASRT